METLRCVALIFTAEFARRARSRIFVFATLAGAFGIAAVIEAPALLLVSARTSTGPIVLAGPKALRASAARLFESKDGFRVVGEVDALPRPVTLAFLDAHGRAAAAVALSQRDRHLRVDVYPRDLTAFDNIGFRSLAPLNLALVRGVTQTQAAAAYHIDKHLHAVDSKFSDAPRAELAHELAFGLLFILYLAIVVAAQSVMASVAEEKTSRIAEILVATVSPANLLAGKIAAAAALAILQLAAWVAIAVLLLPQALASMTRSAGLEAMPSAAAPIDVWEIAAFAACFVLGYLQYAALYAAAGSLVSRTEDLGTISAPIIIPVVGAFAAGQYAMLQPNAPASIALTFEPLISPFVTFARIATATVPAWQTTAAFALNALVVAVSFSVAGSVYRVGMLLYGRPPTLRQIVAALRG